MKKKKIAFDVLLFLSFLIPVAIMLTIFMINKIYPFGKNSFLYMDLYHQYMPFFTEFMEKISAGESLNYSFRVGVGSNFLALYVYYLASPIHFLAFLFPREHLVEFISYLVILKIGFTGMTGCYYLKKHFQTESPICVGLSVMYALSGFMAAYNWNIMWLDCVVLLPLIMLGLEQLVKEGKWKMYCLALACSIYTNFYISIMICMFLVLYFLCLLITERFSLQAIVKFGVFSLLAGGLASVLLIPEVCAIMATDFGDISFPKEIKTYFSVLDELARHCVGVSVERGLKHWPNIYCGSFVFLLVPLYAICPKISAKKRLVNLALIGFFLLGFSTNVLEFIWHGMNYPDSLPARQSFIYVLLVLTVCGEVLLHIREMEQSKILYSFLGTVVFLLFCQKFIEDDHFKTGVFLMTLVFAAFYSILLYLYRTRPGENWKAAMIGCAIAIVIIEAGVNTYQTSVPYIVRDNYLNPLKDYEALTQQAFEREESLGNSSIFRFDKFVRKTKNDGTLAGFPSASLFSSTLNSQVMDLYKKLGLPYSKVFYCHDGASAFVSALLNVRYMYDQQSDKESAEENGLYTKLAQSGDVTLFASEKVLPFGYVAPVGFDLPEGVENSPFTIQNQLVNALGIEEDLFLKSRSTQSGDNVELMPVRSGYYYMMVTSSGTKKVKAEGDISRKYDNLKRYETMYVGELKAGEKVTFSNDDKDDTTPTIYLSAYRMDEEVLDKALEALSRQHMTDVVYEDSHLTGRLNLTEAGRLILTVPYEKGWTVRVNGEITEPQLFGEAFIALDLQPGEYTIDMEYVPYGKPQGLAITLVSLLVLAGIWIAEYLHGKKQASTVNTAPEEAC